MLVPVAVTAMPSPTNVMDKAEAKMVVLVAKAIIPLVAQQEARPSSLPKRIEPFCRDSQMSPHTAPAPAALKSIPTVTASPWSTCIAKTGTITT